MDVLHIITWNLNWNEAVLKQALQWMETRSGPALALLQETPTDLTQVLKRRGNVVRLAHEFTTRGQSVAKSNAILFSGDVSLSCGTDDGKEIAFARLTVFGLEVEVVSLHAISRVTTKQSVGTRMERASELMEWVNGKRNPNVPLIMGGDFNTDPFDEDMWRRSCYYALRDRALVRRLESDSSVRGRVPLYNPCWRLLSDWNSPADTPSGTYWVKRHEHANWNCFDQVLVSHHLMDSIRSVEILTEWPAGNPLGAIKRVHFGCFQGDHLPTVATIEVTSSTGGQDG